MESLKKQFPEFDYGDTFQLLEMISSGGFELVVFIDQFEELFTLSGHQGTKSKMLSFLKEILDNNNISIKMVLSLREDFLAELWDISEQNQIPDLYDRQKTYRLKKLSRENAKQTIVNTIKHVNYSIEDHLVEQLLDEFTQHEETIYPPYIQIVCHEIFKHHKEAHKDKSKETPIDSPSYGKLGGVEKIITDYFEEILDGFSYEERTVIHEILAEMITYFKTKQRITYEQIQEINNNRIDIDKTLDRLIKHRIIIKIETEKDEYELIHDFLAKKILENKPARGISSRTKKAVEYIENNFVKQFSLEDIANDVGFSREHFCRKFKLEMNMNFTDFVNKRRIEEAKKYIRKEPGVKVSEIYRQIGFTNQQHFTKIFKKVTGDTPNAYKKTILEENT